MEEIRLFRYVLHGEWDGGKFTYPVIADSKETAKEKFEKHNPPVHPSCKIVEYEVKESLTAYYQPTQY